MRNKNLDLLKWLAIITMVIDHLRFVVDWGYLLLFCIGRLAFPLFCLIIALNLHNSPYALLDAKHKRYMLNIIVFAVLSELPYRMFLGDADTLNIMPTLGLGVALILVLFKTENTTPVFQALAASGILLFSLAINPILSYGVLGVALPAFFYLFHQQKSLVIAVCTVILSVACNMQYHIDALLSNDHSLLFRSVLFVTFAAFAAIAPCIGWLLMNTQIKCNIYPIKRLGYWFYPAHLLILSLFI